MASRESNPKKKRVILSVSQKLELIRKLEAGASVTRVYEVYGVRNQTVSDIRKSKEKLTAFSLKYNVNVNCEPFVGVRKRMRVAKDTKFDEAVTK